MTQVTEIIEAIKEGDSTAAQDLLPIVYDELRHLARRRLAHEQPGQTLQATALVHEAYVRLTGSSDVEWNGASHFFGAAAEAMRRIMIERARKRRSTKHGGDKDRVELNSRLLGEAVDERLVRLDEALDDLAAYDQRKAQVVKLRFFAGLTNAEVAGVLDISPATADRDWTFAKAWLFNEISEDVS